MPARKRKWHKKKPLADKGITCLTKKQRGALKNYVDQGFKNKQMALDRAGYVGTKNTNLITSLVSRKPIITWLEKKGVGDEKIATVMAEGLEAMHAMKPDQPDHHARVKFVSEANRIFGNYAPTKIQSDERVITINLSGEDMKALQKFNELRKPDAED